MPRGIALPFGLNQTFLEASPKIQQMLGKLKMALELNAREIEPLCLTLMNMMRSQRMSDAMRESIDSMIANRTMVGRDGATSIALPHDELVEVMRRYGRM